MGLERTRRDLNAAARGASLPATTAVEPPLVRIAPGTRIRRHRRLPALSGILLFALRAVSVIAAAAGVVVLPVVPELGIPELVFGVALLGVLGPGRTTEPRVASAAGGRAAGRRAPPGMISSPR